MTILDKLFLLLTGLTAIYLIVHFFKEQKQKKGSYNFYYIISFLVLLVAGLLLIIFGWSALKDNFVAVVAGLIPFGIANGLIAKYYPKHEKWFMGLMLVGLVSIAITRYAGMVTAGKIVYPVFHAIAGLTIFFVPICVVKSKNAKTSFLFVTLGGTLIGLGGIALAFLSAGKQLLFFSPTFVITILAPLLFLMALSYAVGFTKGEK